MTKRKDGLWQEAVTINGKRKYFYGKTKAEVLRKINEYKEKEEVGKTFEEVADEWWEEHENRIAFYTARSYKPALERAKEAFEGVHIRYIKPSQISREIKKFSLTHADKTVRTQLMIFNLIFKFAVEMGYIEVNPVRELSVPDNLPKRKVTVPPAQDIDRVKTSVDCTFGLFAFWALYTGMRRGEILAIRWEDINFDKRTISVNKSVVHVRNVPQIKEPKTAKGFREVPILDKLYEIIYPIRKSKGFVFSNAEGQLLSETQWQRQWELYTKESGITSTAHQFRHAFATMLFENNISEKDAQEILGHAQLSTTMDIYTEIRETRRLKIYEKLLSADIV